MFCVGATIDGKDNRLILHGISNIQNWYSKIAASLYRTGINISYIILSCKILQFIFPENVEVKPNPV